MAQWAVGVRYRTPLGCGEALVQPVPAPTPEEAIEIALERLAESRGEPLRDGTYTADVRPIQRKDSPR